MKHALYALAFSAALLPGAALADDAKCGQLKIINSVQMMRSVDGTRDYIPVSINEDPTTRFFLFDTGGYISQISPGTYYQLGMIGQAMDDINAALNLRPDFPEALFLRGLIKGRSGDMTDHDADIAAADTMAPGEDVSFYRLGLYTPSPVAGDTAKPASP